MSYNIQAYHPQLRVSRGKRSWDICGVLDDFYTEAEIVTKIDEALGPLLAVTSPQTVEIDEGTITVSPCGKH